MGTKEKLPIVVEKGTEELVEELDNVPLSHYPWRVQLLVVHYLYHVFLKEAAIMGATAPAVANYFQRQYGTDQSTSNLVGSCIILGYYGTAAVFSLVTPRLGLMCSANQQQNMARIANTAFFVARILFATLWLPSIAAAISATTAAVSMISLHVLNGVLIVISNVQLNTQLAENLIEKSPKTFSFVTAMYCMVFGVGMIVGYDGGVLVQVASGNFGASFMAFAGLSAVPCILTELLPPPIEPEVETTQASGCIDNWLAPNVMTFKTIFSSLLVMLVMGVFGVLDCAWMLYGEDTWGWSAFSAVSWLSVGQVVSFFLTILHNMYIRPCYADKDSFNPLSELGGITILTGLGMLVLVVTHYPIHDWVAVAALQVVFVTLTPVCNSLDVFYTIASKGSSTMTRFDNDTIFSIFASVLNFGAGFGVLYGGSAYKVLELSLQSLIFGSTCILCGMLYMAIYVFIPNMHSACDEDDDESQSHLLKPQTEA